MDERYERTIGLIGEDAVKKLMGKRVAVFGLGGVGGHVAEALARSGVGALDVIDGDTVAPSNLNRQLFATVNTVGMLKTRAARERLNAVAPDLTVTEYPIFFGATTPLDFKAFDYVIDAVDTVSAKIEIIKRARAANVPVISSMGAGNKLDPTAFKVADIYQTRVCPLARIMRKLCRENGIESLKVVYSEEEPKTASRTPSSIAFVPSVAGLIIAGEVVKDLVIS